MIPRPWLLRAVERHLRAKGHSKANATRFAADYDAQALFRMLPLHRRATLQFRHAKFLIGEKVRRILPVRSGTGRREAAEP